MQTVTSTNKQATEAALNAERLQKEIYGSRDTESAPANESKVEKKPDDNPRGFDSPAQQEPRQGPDYKQQFQTLQGKYNAEINQLNAQVKYLEKDRQELRTQVSQLTQDLVRAQAAQTTQQPAKQEEEEVDYFDGYEEELRLGVDKRIEQALKPLQEQLSNAEPAQAQQAQDDGGSDDRLETVAMLVGGVDRFQAIDNNPKFQDWIQQPISDFENTTRHEAMNRAFDDNKLDVVARFFNVWANSQQSELRAKTDAGLQEYVSPDTVRTEQDPQESKGRRYSRAEISQFFKDVSTGKYKGREDEARSIEIDIIAAQGEGRIIG